MQPRPDDARPGRERWTPTAYARLALFAALALAIALGSGFEPVLSGPTQPPQDELRAPHRTDRIVVKFKDDARRPAAERHALGGGRPYRLLGRSEAEVVEIAPGTVGDKLAAYRADPNVEYAEPVYLARAFDTPNDPYFNSQWALQKIEAPAAWDLGQSSADVLIAILDTGIDLDHEDLGSKVVRSENFSDSSTANDYYGHGTHVAGIAAATTANGRGVAGLARGARLMNGKVLADDGYGDYTWIAEGIRWAADNDAKVINMSLGGDGGSTLLAEAINYAWNKGVVIVAAAGNESTSLAIFPAYYTNVIAVASTTSSDQMSSFSNYGSWVDLAAPGSSIVSTLPNHPNEIGSTNYGYLSGTSMATPHVAGLAALLWASPHGTSAQNVRSRIESSTDWIPGTGSSFRFGRINARKAMEAASQPTQTPTPSPSPTPTQSVGGSWVNDSVRIVLRWSGSVDLDSYLWLPDAVDDLVYWANRGSLQSAPFALLDRDGNTSKQPETIQLARRFPGTYVFGVHRPAGGNAAAAKPRVTIYRGRSTVASFSASSKSSGSWWCPFELDGATGAIKKIDRYGSSCGESNQPLQIKPVPPTPTPRRDDDN